MRAGASRPLFDGRPICLDRRAFLRQFRFMTKPMLPPEIAAAVIDPTAYAAWEPLHDQLAWARANAPLAVAETATHNPFWPVTRHAATMAIARHPQPCPNGVRPTGLTSGEASGRER